MSPASGGRTRAASCGPRRLQRAEGRGSRPWASLRGLGSQRSPLAGGSALVWTAFRGRAFLSGPHSLHRLLCSRSRGAARRVPGAAGGTEVRAGWGRGSERVHAANLVFGERDMTNLSEIQIGESAFCRGRFTVLCCAGRLMCLICKGKSSPASLPLFSRIKMCSYFIISWPLKAFWGFE